MSRDFQNEARQDVADKSQRIDNSGLMVFLAILLAAVPFVAINITPSSDLQVAMLVAAIVVSYIGAGTLVVLVHKRRIAIKTKAEVAKAEQLARKLKADWRERFDNGLS